MRKTEEILKAAKEALTPHKFVCFEFYMRQYQRLCDMTPVGSVTAANFNAWAPSMTFLEREMKKLYPFMDAVVRSRRRIPWGDLKADGVTYGGRTLVKVTPNVDNTSS